MSNSSIHEMAQKVVLWASDPATIPPGRSDSEERAFSEWKNRGTSPHMDEINKNIQEGRTPFEGLSFEDKKELLSFIVYMRENISTKPSDNPNFESAMVLINGDHSLLSEKDLNTHLVKQLNRYPRSGLSKPITVKDGKVVTDEKG